MTERRTIVNTTLTDSGAPPHGAVVVTGASKGFWALPGGAGLQWPGFVADTAPEALLVMLVGCVAATAAAAFVLVVAQAHAALGRVLLERSRRENLK
jgi:hypothetical protein